MIERIFVSGFRSFSTMCPMDVELKRINLLIGANGAGKSNVVSIFRLLNAMATTSLQRYVATEGVGSLLHGGAQQTASISMCLRCSHQGLRVGYGFKLNFGLPNRLYISDEYIEKKDDLTKEVIRSSIYSDSNEAGIWNLPIDPFLDAIKLSIVSVYIYQFNNTALGSPIRMSSGIYDCAALRCDGGNLAAYLKLLRDTVQYRPYYNRIVSMIRSVMPQFNDFTLNQDANGSVWLTWRDFSHPTYEFGPHQFSDGTLRFVALATALLSPPKLMPSTIVLDEPELGLHPQSIAKLAGMIKMASSVSQIIVATQTPLLVNSFNLDDICVIDVDRNLGCSNVRRLSTAAYKEWLSQYTLSDLWEKNIIGGQP